MSEFYLREDTLIRADNKLIPIQDLKEGMSVQSFIENDRLFYHGIVECVTFKDSCQFYSLKAGKREIIATENTPIATSKSDGYVWREAGGLRPGSVMIIQSLDSMVSFHEPVISIEKAGTGRGAMISLKKYDNFVAEGFPVHTESLPHVRKNKFFNF